VNVTAIRDAIVEAAGSRLRGRHVETEIGLGDRRATTVDPMIRGSPMTSQPPISIPKFGATC